jgi:hypothetical protein
VLPYSPPVKEGCPKDGVVILIIHYWNSHIRLDGIAILSNSGKTILNHPLPLLEKRRGVI